MSSQEQNYPVRTYSESYITKNKSFFILFTYSISLYNHYWHLRMYLYIYTKSTEVLCYLHTMSNQGFLNYIWILCLFLWWPFSVGFWCQGIAQKFFRTFDTSFKTKMMMKSGAIEIIFKFHEPSQNVFTKTSIFQNSNSFFDWIDKFTSNSKRAHGIWKWFQRHHFLPSLSSQNWCQTSWRIFYYSLAPKTYSALS